MKILFLSDNFPPEVNAPASRTYEHCIEWVKFGAEITVITCQPNFPQGKIYKGYKNSLYKTEKMNGIKVIRVWSFISPNKGIFKRVLDYLSFAVMAFFASFFVKADLIIATSPQFFTAVSGFFVSVFKRKPWVMEVRDLWPESIKAVTAIKGGLFLRLLERLEMFLYNRATRIIVVTDAFKQNIKARGILETKIDVVKNGVDLTSFQPSAKNENLIKQLKLQDKFIVSYIGTHGLSHGLEFILRCSSKVSTGIHFLFIGDGAEKEKLQLIRDKLDLANVTMLPPVPKSRIKDYIALSDAALVNLIKSDTFKTVIPSKIFENAAMQKPILLGVQGESEDIIKHYGAGICFDPENEIDFLEKLNLLQNNSQFYQSCQIGCMHLAEDFDRQFLAFKMFSILCDLLGVEPSSYLHLKELSPIAISRSGSENQVLS